MSIWFADMQAEDKEDLFRMMQALYAEDGDGEQVAKLHMNMSQTHMTALRRHANIRITMFINDDPRVENIGYALVCYVYSNEYGGFLAHIDELFVERRWRNNGIATNFFQHIEEERIWSGIPIVGIELELNPTNKSALSLYTKVGLEPTQRTHLRKIRR